MNTKWLKKLVRNGDKIKMAANANGDELKLTGKVSKVFIEKGYAFIACSSDGRDYFAHHSQVLRGSIAFRNLKEGMEVSFNPKENPDKTKGPIAEGVMLV